MKTRILLVPLAAVVLLAACKGKSGGKYEFINNHSSASSSADTIATDSLKPSAKLVKTAGINFKVKNVQQTSEGIAVLTREFGGMVMHHKILSSPGQNRNVYMRNDSIMRIAAYHTSAEMTVKVPSDRLEDLMTKVCHMGIYVNSNTLDIGDKTLDYLSARLKLKDRQELISQQKRGTIRIKNPNDVLLLKDDIVDAQIGNLKTDEAVRFSAVDLNFYQSDTIIKELIANDDPSSYNLPVVERLSLALASGWSVFIDVLVLLTNLWVFILAGFCVWASYRYYRKKPELIDRPTA